MALNPFFHCHHFFPTLPTLSLPPPITSLSLFPLLPLFCPPLRPPSSIPTSSTMSLIFLLPFFDRNESTCRELFHRIPLKFLSNAGRARRPPGKTYKLAGKGLGMFAIYFLMLQKFNCNCRHKLSSGKGRRQASGSAAAAGDRHTCILTEKKDNLCRWRYSEIREKGRLRG